MLQRKMIQMISDDLVIVAAFERVPDALLQYRFIVRAGKRDFIGASMLLRKASGTELELRLRAYIRSDDELKELQSDKGATFEDIAGVLADSPNTVRRHYAKRTPEYQSRQDAVIRLVHGTNLSHTNSATVTC